MQNKTVWIALGILVAIGVAGFFLTRRPASNNQAGSVSPTSTPVAQESPLSEGSAREIVVTASEYAFSPGSIAVAKGEKIKLTFRNMGGLSHNLVIDDLNVSTRTIPRGEEDTLEFTATAEGTFTFYCSVGNHQSLGMEGEIEVR